MEGNHCYIPSSGCVRTGRILPVTEYSHGGGRCSITGGYVYRGKTYPDLVGAYLFADYCSGEIWFIDRGASRGVRPTLAIDTSSHITSFGEDEAGELYVTDAGGTVYRVSDGEAPVRSDSGYRALVSPSRTPWDGRRDRCRPCA